MDKQELERYSYFGLHNHTTYSNLRLKDAINKVEDLLDYSLKIGLKGIAITDHEILSAHMKALNYVKHNEKFKNFKLGLGNEIYLVDRGTINAAVDSNNRTRFYHFILCAKNKHGYNFLMQQSSQAWANRFTYHGMERVPTYIDWLETTMQKYKGDIIASTACIGGRLPQLLIEYDKDPGNQELRVQINDFIQRMIKIFGKDDFYLEVQPSHHEEQQIVNKWLFKLSKAYGLKIIVTTDAHYLNKEQKEAHKVYLKSENDSRDVDSFYDTTYLMGVDELREYFSDEELTELLTNTHEIMDKIESYSLDHETIIPKAHIPRFTKVDLDKEHPKIDWNQYKYIRNYEHSKEVVDQYYLRLIMDGMDKRKQPFDHVHLSRIDIELEQLWEISLALKQPMASYFVVEKEFVDTMWEVSLVGVARGSAACFYINYLIDITQISAIDYDLPYWRFLSKERIGSWPDIDEDAEGSRRQDIIQLVKDKFGEGSVLNCGTFTTEQSRSAVLTACRGYGIDNVDANNMLDDLPTEKGFSWPLQDAFFGNDAKGRKPAKQFIQDVDQYEGLQEIMLSIQGLVSGRSQHASGVFVWNGPYTEHDAMMETKSGLSVTQFDADDSEEAGAIKYDFLSINALDRIRAAMDLLLKEHKIEWQGSLRDTFNKYFHPDNLDLSNPKMYEMLANGEVLNAFQFETDVGKSTLAKIKAKNFDEIEAANSLMRLTTSGEQPIDKYIRFKNDISQWYQEMDDQGLSQQEQEVIKKRLAPRYGICDTQEYLMEIAMDQNIGNYNLLQANKLRKSVAKKDEKLQEAQKKLWFEKGRDNDTSDAMLNYVWDFCFKPLFG